MNHPADTQALRSSLDEALDADISPKAFRLLVAALVRTDGPATCADLAAAAGRRDHQARPLVGELTAAQLLTSSVVLLDGTPGRRPRAAVVYTPAGVSA